MAVKCTLKELFPSPRRGWIIPLAHEMCVLPQSSLSFITSPPVLHWWVQLNKTLKDMKEEKGSWIRWLHFKFSPSSSL